MRRWRVKKRVQTEKKRSANYLTQVSAVRDVILNQALLDGTVNRHSAFQRKILGEFVKYSQN